VKKALSILVLISLVFAISAQTVIPTFTSAKAATRWVYDNIEYDYHVSSISEAQTPKHTIRIGSGNCTDMAVLLVAILIQGGADPKDIRYIGLQNSVGAYHLVVLYNDMYLDCTNGECTRRPPIGYHEFARYPVTRKK